MFRTKKMIGFEVLYSIGRVLRFYRNSRMDKIVNVPDVKPAMLEGDVPPCEYFEQFLVHWGHDVCFIFPTCKVSDLFLEYL